MVCYLSYIYLQCDFSQTDSMYSGLLLCDFRLWAKLLKTSLVFLCLWAGLICTKLWLRQWLVMKFGTAYLLT